MRIRVIFSLLLGASAALGCSKPAEQAQPEAHAAQAKLDAVTVDQLDHLLAGHACRAVDANDDLLRKKMGVIPGAVLLTDMDAVNELPADKNAPLVFYCANTACDASGYAAHKAIAAGYTHVQVLPEGIAGWVKAGKQTTSI